MSDKPDLVVRAEALADAFQSGNDSRMLGILRPSPDESPFAASNVGLIAELMGALYAANDRTLTYAAPQIAALAARVGWVQEQGE